MGFFDYLLDKANVVGTPGSGFGPSGEGYFRLTAFGTYENTLRPLRESQRCDEGRQKRPAYEVTV